MVQCVMAVGELHANTTIMRDAEHLEWNKFMEKANQ